MEWKIYVYIYYDPLRGSNPPHMLILWNWLRPILWVPICVQALYHEHLLPPMCTFFLFMCTLPLAIHILCLLFAPLSPALYALPSLVCKSSFPCMPSFHPCTPSFLYATPSDLCMSFLHLYASPLCHSCHPFIHACVRYLLPFLEILASKATSTLLMPCQFIVLKRDKK